MSFRFRVVGIDDLKEIERLLNLGWLIDRDGSTTNVYILYKEE